MKSRLRRFSVFELFFRSNWIAALIGWCSGTTVDAQIDNAFAADFSAYEKKYPWTVSRALIDKKTPGAVPETNFDEAWGASRAVDYFVTDPDIDAAKIAVVGHSRGGKTSLWAGAQDVRIGLVIPNNAGDGGPSIARRRFGNTIEVMTGRNPHWFVARHASHARHEAAMPFDQHMLIALVAPRGYHGGGGVGRSVA